MHFSPQTLCVNVKLGLSEYLGTRVVPVHCSCDNTSLYVVVLLFLQISMPFSLLSMTPHLVSGGLSTIETGC